MNVLLAAVAGTMVAIVISNAVGITQAEVDALVAAVCGLVTAITVLIYAHVKKPPKGK